MGDADLVLLATRDLHEICIGWFMEGNLMFVQLLYFLAAQIIFGVIFSCIGLLKVRQRQRALRQEIAAEDTSVEAYQRFAAARRRITYPSLKFAQILLFGCIGLTTLVVVLFVIFLGPFDLTAIQALPDLFWPLTTRILYLLVLFLLFSLALGIGHSIGWLVFSLVGALVVDAEAVRVFCVSRLQRREILTLNLRSALFNMLPGILCCEAIALPFLYVPLTSPSIFLLSWNSLPVQRPSAFTFLLLFFFALCVVGTVGEVVYGVFRGHLYAFTNALQPMTQTQWAHLAPRIAAYARLAGVEFSSIQVQQDLPGTFNVGCLGLRKPMLFISEFFLRHSEWRQQDAIVSLVIGLVKKRVNRYTLLSKLASSALVIALILLLLLGNIVFLLALEPIIIIPSLLLSLIGVWALFDRASSYFRRLQTRNYREADRIASFLTGDPVALMVALDVLYAFNGERLDHYSEQTRRLDELAHQSWPHAPQATLPVPAVFALGFGSRYLGTSLDQATSPDPVPTTLYQNLPD
jgi:hypothetical protein